MGSTPTSTPTSNSFSTTHGMRTPNTLMTTTTAPFSSQDGSSNGTGAKIGTPAMTVKTSTSGSQELEQQTSASVIATLRAKVPTMPQLNSTASATGSSATSQPPPPRATTTAPATLWRTTSSPRPGQAGSDGEQLSKLSM